MLVCIYVCIADDTARLRAVLESAQCNIYSSRQLFKLAQDAYKRAVPPLNSGALRCRPLLDAALELGLQVLPYLSLCFFSMFIYLETRFTRAKYLAESFGRSLALTELRPISTMLTMFILS